MKGLITLTLISITPINIFANDFAWIDKQIQEIEKSRSSIKNSTISNIKNPFIFLEKNGYNIVKVKITNKVVKKSSTKPILEMIINKSALINSKWYKVNGVVDGYKIKTINKTNVIISFQKKEYTLSLKSKTNNLIKK
jgi:hypothetical protein